MIKLVKIESFVIGKYKAAILGDKNTNGQEFAEATIVSENGFYLEFFHANNLFYF